MSEAVVVYADGEQKELTEPKLAHTLLINFLYTVQNFLHTLWIVKDHAVNFELGFLQVIPKNGIPYNNCNLVADSRSLSDCSVRNTEFSKDEIRVGNEIFTSRFKVGVRPEDFTSDSPMLHRGGIPKQLTSHKEVNRLERFFCFLSNARSSNDLGIKIAMYCTCLEALFTTDSTELTHKISERAAAFLCETVEARIATYQIIKKAYSIRSKVMHGDSISEKLRSELPAVAGSTDGILRAISLKLLSHEELLGVFMLERDGLEDYFLSLTCSGPEPQFPVSLAETISR